MLQIKLLSLFFFAFVTYTHSVGQKYQYGRVSEYLLSINTNELDQSAPALITHLGGHTIISEDRQNGFEKKHTFKKQVKVFDPTFPDLDIITIGYYSPKRNVPKDKVISFKASMYKMEGGKINKISLNYSDADEEQINDYFKQITLKLPSLTPNCVYEYEYTIVYSDPTNFEDFVIQQEFPVLFADYIFSVNEKYQIDLKNVGKDIPTEKSNSNVGKYYFAYEHVYPFVREPYMANPFDHNTKIVHMLDFVKTEYGFEYFNNNYQALANSLFKDQNFQSVLDDGKFINSFVRFPKSTTALEKAKTIYEYFQENVKWNNSYGFRAEQRGKALFKKKSGSIGEINLNYVAALQELNIPAYPVLLSTRGHGSIEKNYARFENFNYLVALIDIDSDYYLVDASSSLDFGKLSIFCLNDFGALYQAGSFRWVKLHSIFGGENKTLTKISLEGTTLKYNQQISRSGYFAQQDYDDFLTEDTIKYANLLCYDDAYRTDSFNIISHQKDQIKINAISSREIMIDSQNTNLVIQPFIHTPYNFNPFESNQRISEVSFPYKESYTLVSNISIENAEVVNIPEQFSKVLDNGWMSFKFNHQYLPQFKTLQVIFEFNINKTYYTLEEYPFVSDFFEEMGNYLNGYIILKRGQ